MLRLLCSLVLLCTALRAADKLTVTWMASPAHGLAVVVETPGGKVLLIDTGGTARTPDYNTGRDTIAPFLKKRGHDSIDAIVISHPHGDHYGGAEWLMQNMKVARFIDNGFEGRGQTLAYKRLRSLAQERGGSYQACHAGSRIDLDPALVLEVLSPPSEFLSLDADPAKVSEHGLLNSNSIVLRMQHGRNVFIFPGDSYGGAFERHMKTIQPPEKLHTTVLTAPHHGFNPGFDFPKMLMPKHVVVSCLADYVANAGTPNPRSPGDRAIDTFTPLGAEVLVTAFNGNITAVSDGDKVVMTKDHERIRP